MVAQLKPEIIEIQQARTKQVHPLTPTQRPFKTTPEHNQYMDEFPVSPFFGLVLSLLRVLAGRAVKKGIISGICVPDSTAKSCKGSTETTEAKRFMIKSNLTASEVASCRDAALVICLSEITYFLGLVQ